MWVLSVGYMCGNWVWDTYMYPHTECGVQCGGVHEHGYCKMYCQAPALRSGWSSRWRHNDVSTHVSTSTRLVSLVEYIHVSTHYVSTSTRLVSVVETYMYPHTMSAPAQGWWVWWRHTCIHTLCQHQHKVGKCGGDIHVSTHYVSTSTRLVSLVETYMYPHTMSAPAQGWWVWWRHICIHTLCQHQHKVGECGGDIHVSTHYVSTSTRLVSVVETYMYPHTMSAPAQGWWVWWRHTCIHTLCQHQHKVGECGGDIHVSTHYVSTSTRLVSVVETYMYPHTMSAPAQGWWVWWRHTCIHTLRQHQHKVGECGGDIHVSTHYVSTSTRLVSVVETYMYPHTMSAPAQGWWVWRRHTCIHTLCQHQHKVGESGGDIHVSTHYVSTSTRLVSLVETYMYPHTMSAPAQGWWVWWRHTCIHTLCQHQHKVGECGGDIHVSTHYVSTSTRLVSVVETYMYPHTMSAPAQSWWVWWRHTCIHTLCQHQHKVGESGGDIHVSTHYVSTSTRLVSVVETYMYPHTMSPPAQGWWVWWRHTCIHTLCQHQHKVGECGGDIHVSTHYVSTSTRLVSIDMNTVGTFSLS